MGFSGSALREVEVFTKFRTLPRIFCSSAFLSDEHDNLLKLSEIRSFHDSPTVRCYPDEFRCYPNEFRCYPDEFRCYPDEFREVGDYSDEYQANQ
jgi:hypothetical protein